MCQGNLIINLRTIPSSSRLKLCPNNSKKSGSKSLTISTTSSISSNPTKWFSSLWMAWLQDRKWITNDPEGSRAPETTNNLLNDFTATARKTPTVNKTSKTIQFRLVLNSWKNLTKWSTFSFRKRSKKMITGKTWAWFSLVRTAPEKASTK